VSVEDFIREFIPAHIKKERQIVPPRSHTKPCQKCGGSGRWPVEYSGPPGKIKYGPCVACNGTGSVFDPSCQ
jgi:DnaJ-class molecular chaperone